VRKKKSLADLVLPRNFETKERFLVRPFGSPYANGLLSCCRVCNVYRCQTARWIRIPLGTEVGLGPGDIVLNGTQLSP